MQLDRRQLWLILLVQTVFFVALAAWILVRLDRIFEPVSLFVALAIIVIGDLAAVLMMQRFAPTRITFSAGEHELTGQALDGFAPGNRGHVLVNGEKWLARCRGSARIAPGDRISVVSRSGLTLDVERIGGSGENLSSDAGQG